ncbi:MAG: glycosyltransferase [Lachnospiraceae bacterium]|nr:glycosyltransferase [Lachnospiraceae bacterium]
MEMQEKKWNLAIVVLNYEAYQETEKCVDSIFSKKIEVAGIVIVDNASKNNSVPYLRKKYQCNEKIKIVRSLKNTGFAKGNNLGIKIARRTWNVEFVLLLNSDTIMLQEDYIERMMKQYQVGTAVIQSNALRTNKRYTNKTYVHYSLKELLMNYIKGICDAYDIYCFTYRRKQGDLGPIISGCDFLLTPYFFKIFQGLYPLTFLFLEEPILMIMLRKAGLNSRIAEDAVLLHKESMSTPDNLKMGKNERKKILCAGYRHMLLVRVLPMWALKKIVNHGEW